RRWVESLLAAIAPAVTRPGLTDFVETYVIFEIGQLQVDNAVLFEGVNNALKLLGDQYLARVYRLVSDRFHLAEWDASILRKLQSLESIYQKLSDEAANRRTETLEWIVIVLIAVEILIPFVPRLVGLR